MTDTPPLRLKVDPNCPADLRLALADSGAEWPSAAQLSALHQDIQVRSSQEARLRSEAAGPSADLRLALADGPEELPSEAQLDSLWKRLTPHVGASTTPTAHPARRRRGKSRRALLVILGWSLPAAAAIAGGYRLYQTRAASPAEPPNGASEGILPQKAAPSSPPRRQPPPPASSSPEAAAQDTAIEGRTNDADAIPPRASVDQRQPSPILGEATKPRAPESSALGEFELLREAQAARTGDPARALALARRHERLYPQGVLTQERELVAIEALSALGRHELAAERARRFEQRHPGSAHLPRIRRLLMGSSASTGTPEAAAPDDL